jgi:hypothetical protein
MMTLVKNTLLRLGLSLADCQMIDGEEWHLQCLVGVNMIDKMNFIWFIRIRNG